MIKVVSVMISFVYIQLIIVNAFAYNMLLNDKITARPVAVIINSELFADVEYSIERYLEDLKNEGYEVFFSQWDYSEYGDVEELKAVLKDYYEEHKIQGAVLIGELPYAVGYTREKVDDKGPIDRYLMNFKEENFLRDEEGCITVGENYDLDIWVSRIWAKPMGVYSEVDLVRKYFEKNHFYRTCRAPVPDLKLKFHASENKILSTFSGDAEYRNSWWHWYEYLGKSGDADDYLKFVKDNIGQYLFLESHSSIGEHTFHKVLGSEYLDWEKVLDIGEIKQPFVLLNASSACNFVDSHSLGNVYLFSPHSSVLVIAGLAITGSLLDVELLHSNGNIFGDNFKEASNNKGDARMEMNRLSMMLVGMAMAASWVTTEAIEIAAKVVFWNIFLEFTKHRAMRWLFGTKSESFGHTLLGDPTLRPYVDMSWCPEYDGGGKESL